MTSTGSIIGSVHYFSPEQAKGKYVGNTTDLYSLGIVLYEMIIGRVPFRGDSPISIALQHINDEIEFTQEEKVAIPQSVRNIIKKLTSKSSDDRYQGADELIEDIEYIEKNIDLDFIKEYDNYATKKIDESEITKAINQNMNKASTKIDDDEEDEDIVRRTPKRRNNKNKKEDSPKTKRMLKIAAVVLTLILLAQIFLFAKFFLIGKSQKVEQGITPEFRNLTLSQAERLAEKVGAKVRVRLEEYSTEVEEGKIISQAPQANMPINEGDTITVVISKGNKEVDVPSLVGRTIGEAETILKDAKLNVNYKFEYSDTYTKDTVISQSPSLGSIDIGGTVTIVVSKGPQAIENEENNNPETPVEPQTPINPPSHNEGNNTENNNGGNLDNTNTDNNNGSGESTTPPSDTVTPPTEDVQDAPVAQDITDGQQ
jgi:serine/threonine-protein kinase